MTPHLLVVGLERFGRPEVHDAAHVGLVDAHPEGHGGHHCRELVVQEPLVHRRPESQPARTTEFVAFQLCAPVWFFVSSNSVWPFKIMLAGYVFFRVLGF